jgi:tripartite-type tricarboxylate transporter receptor subunit TctC
MIRRWTWFGGPKLAASVLAVFFAAIGADGASSQSNRTIKIIITFPAGSGGDVLTRVMAEQISQVDGPRFTFENADQFLGAEAVARAAPDGNTLLVINNNFAVNPKLRKPPYDPLTSFIPICNLASGPMLIIADAAGPFHTLADLLMGAREKPGELAVIGTELGPPQIAFEMLTRAAKADMTFLPGSTAAAISGLASQKIAGAIQLFLNVQGQLRTGKVRALAITSRARKEVLPDVPTVAESGFPDYEVEYWDGIYAPAGASQKTVDQLAGWFGAAARTPAVKATLAAQTYVPVGVCGPEFITFIHKELERYGRVISEAGIRGE